MQFADFMALRRRALELVTILLRLGWCATGKGKFWIGKNDFDIGTLRPNTVTIVARVLGRDPSFDVGVMHHHAEPGNIARGKNVFLPFDPHIVADLESTARIQFHARRFQFEVIHRRSPAGGE